MKINVTEVIKDLEGKPFKDGDKELTLRSVFSTALSNPGKDEALTSEVKTRCYALATKIWQGKEIDLTLDERSFIKERADKVFISPIIYGRLCDALEDPKDKEVKSDS